MDVPAYKQETGWRNCFLQDILLHTDTWMATRKSIYDISYVWRIDAFVPISPEALAKYFFLEHYCLIWYIAVIQGHYLSAIFRLENCIFLNVLQLITRWYLHFTFDIYHDVTLEASLQPPSNCIDKSVSTKLRQKVEKTMKVKNILHHDFQQSSESWTLRIIFLELF